MSYCSWDQSSELNIKYHDSEWGVPLHDDGDAEHDMYIGEVVDIIR